MLKQYEKLNKDPHRFMFWMKAKCQANAGHARKTCDIVKSVDFDRLPSQLIKKNQDQPQQLHDNDQQHKFIKSPPLLMLPMPKKPIVDTDANRKTSIKPNNFPAQVLPVQPTPTEPKAKQTVVGPKIVSMKSVDAGKEKNDDGKIAINQRFIKLKNQFKSVHDTANTKMVELQSELGKMQRISSEFNVLAEFFSSEEKLSTIEQNLDRLQKTVDSTEAKIHDINTNNHKMRRMIRDINEAAKRQHQSNGKAIDGIAKRLIRWEVKLDRKMSNHKIDLGEIKLKGSDYEQLKGDIDNMLLNNERLNGISADMQMMKNVIFSIVFLVMLKTIVFDFMQKDFFVAKK